MQRRAFLQLGVSGAQCLLAASYLSACGRKSNRSIATTPAKSPFDNLGLLRDPDENGIRLPEGLTSRVVARSGEAPVGGYVWHPAPDGGAVFPLNDGWIYVSNSEIGNGNGGVGALRFAADGNVIDAYSILEGTSRNCAGGPTPWGTWLSCEEVTQGRVWECDPTGRNLPCELPGLGRFKHEAAAVDPATGQVYLTEDQADGRLYRFDPEGTDLDGTPDLNAGLLQVAQVYDGQVTWLVIPDPAANTVPTRDQVPASTAFDGGEGIAYHAGCIFFTTKGDNRVWEYEIATSNLSVLYDPTTAINPILTGTDNVTVSASGDVLVAEDGGDLQIVVVTNTGTVLPLLQVIGHDGSEIAGLAFTPDMQRLYFSSQRGNTRRSADGITYEVSFVS